MISSYEAEIDDKLERQTFIRSSTGGKERVEKVRSLVAPRSFTTPEKLVVSSGDDYLNCDNTEDRWLKERFPPEAKLVTVPRGDKGFGLIMVEENVSVAIFVHLTLLYHIAGNFQKIADLKLPNKWGYCIMCMQSVSVMAKFTNMFC